MVKFTNFCGIFATTFMVATAITIASCSQDDDDYNSNMYTLAEKMETRSGGDPGNGGGETEPPYINYDHDITKEVDFKIKGSEAIIQTCSVTVNIRYNSNDGEGSAEYKSNNGDIVNLEIKRSSVWINVRQELEYNVLLEGLHIIEHDTLPNDTINVQGRFNGRITIK